MRPHVTVRNEASIQEYGEREAILDFPSAVDAEDLLQQAEDALSRLSDSSQHQQLTVEVHGHDRPTFQLGQKVRVSDQALGVSIVTTVQEIDGTAYSVVLHLGAPPVNLLDILNEDDDDERNQLALSLPPPIGLRARGLVSAIELLLNPFTQSRAVGVEVHMGPTRTFEPDRSTLAATGATTRFLIGGVTPRRRYWLKARSYDDRGNLSDWSEIVSAVPRTLTPGEVDPQTIADIEYAKGKAMVVDAQEHVWNRAQAIGEDLRIHRDALSDNLQDELADLVTGLNDVDGRLIVNESSIETLEDEIELRVTQLDFDALEQTVTSNSATLTVHATEIAARVTTTTFNALNGRVETAETAIQQNADAINLRATTADLEAVEADLSTAVNRIAQAEVDISNHGVTITALDSTVNDLGDDVALAFSEIGVESDRVSIIVADLTSGDPANSTYASLQVLATGIQSVVGDLGDLEDQVAAIAEPFALISVITGAGDRRITGGGDRRVFGQAVAADALGITAAFSLIYQNQNTIGTIVNDIDGVHSQLVQQSNLILARVTHGEMSSALSVLEDEIDLRVTHSDMSSVVAVLQSEIDLRVTHGDMTSAITVAIDGVTVSGSQIDINGNTTFNGDIHVTGGSNTGTLSFYQGAVSANNLRVIIGSVGGKFTAPPGAIGIAMRYDAGIWIEGQPVTVPLANFARMTFNTNTFSRSENPSYWNGNRLLPGRSFVARSSYASINAPSFPAGYRRQLHVIGNNIDFRSPIWEPGQNVTYSLMPRNPRWQIRYRVGTSGTWIELPEGVMSFTVAAGNATSTATQIQVRLLATVTNVGSSELNPADSYTWVEGAAQFTMLHIIGEAG